MAMETWGKWFSMDIDAQLGTITRTGTPRGSLRDAAHGEATAVAPKPSGSIARGFDVHSWLRVCGVPCVVQNCITKRHAAVLQPCNAWLKTGWQTDALATFRGQVPTRIEPPLTSAEQTVVDIVRKKVSTPTPLATASAVARTHHPHGLVAFKYPIAAADRREYQIYVHLLMSVAMLTRRAPVLPMAVCAQRGEWAATSRCVFVLHAAHPAGHQYCVMRPPSPCQGRVALPNVLEGVPPEEVSTVTLPRLGLVNGSVDLVSMGKAIGAAGTAQRVLLIDVSELRTPDDISHLLVTPKGWLCTLEHKSCQMAC